MKSGYFFIVRIMCKPHGKCASLSFCYCFHSVIFTGIEANESSTPWFQWNLKKIKDFYCIHIHPWWLAISMKAYKRNSFDVLMHPSFVTTAPPSPPTHIRDGWGIAGLMCGAVTFWVPLQCRASDIPRGIDYYKKQGYDSQQVPAVQGCDGWKVIVPTIPIGGGGAGGAVQGYRKPIFCRFWPIFSS